MKKPNYSYAGIAFIVLIFGIWAVPKILDYNKKSIKPTESVIDLNNDKPTSTSSDDMSELVVIGKAPQFKLTNQDNKTITNADYKGKVYVVEFFFTTCPSICPIMNGEMKFLENKFFGNPNFGIAAFTINPEVDTPEVLKAYAKTKGVSSPNWHFLTGDKEEILKLSNQGFNLYADANVSENGDFSHSGLFALIDKEGDIRCRKDEFGNPIIYYRALNEEGAPNQIPALKQDIEMLLKE